MGIFGQAGVTVERAEKGSSKRGVLTRVLTRLVTCASWGLAFFLAAPVVSPSPDIRHPVLRFDLGPDGSPVEEGFKRLDADKVYSAESGYGWESVGQSGFDTSRPPRNPAWEGPAGQLVPQDYLIFKEHTASTRDGVASATDLVLRIDLPVGEYEVRLVLGRLDRPCCSMHVSFNGDSVADDVHARHFARRGVPDFLHGFPRVLRRTVRIEEGFLRLRIRGDDSRFRRRFLEEYSRPPPESYLVGTPTRNRKPPDADPNDWGRINPRTGRPGGGVWVYEDIGCPFSENALASVEIYPYETPPLLWSSGRLKATVGDPALESAAEHFNNGQYEEAEAAIRSVKGSYARALGLLWIAGATDFEDERRLLPAAVELLESVALDIGSRDHSDDHLQQARRLQRALRRFDDAGDRQRAYTELLMISGEVDSFEPGDPLFAKGKLYAGRALHMIAPHRWAFSSHAGRQILEQLKSLGHKGRILDWYLDEKWSAEYADWKFASYADCRQNAPRWAAEVFEAYNREIDLAEWWITHRQREDGSLGGGWGDDVEILRSLASFVGSSAGASPLALEGVRKVADGAWRSGSVDVEAGYFAEVGDTEHTGEWTADTLVAMTQSDYGNPVYIERALKTAKLMRDLWMDVNRRGWFLMRSNFLGATGVGPARAASDSRINLRPAAPALAVLRYNSLPAIKDLFVRWADTWLAASLSTDRGKPRGVIPQEIAFEDGRLGGVGSATWYRAAHAPGTVNYDWGGEGTYHDAIVELFLEAFRLTSDRKYLEPLDLEAEFVRRHLPQSVKESPHYGRSGRPHPDLWSHLPEGSKAWVAAKLASWPKTWARMRRVLFPKGDSVAETLRTLEEAERMAARENEYAARRWPHVTTEMIATDRVYFPGLGNAARVLTGIGLVGKRPIVTYAGLGKDFAATVLSADARTLRIALYSFADGPGSAEIVPWLLDVGPEYRIETGPDEDDDGLLDSVVMSKVRRLTHRGRGFLVDLPFRQSTILRIEHETGDPIRSLAPDLALSSRDISFVPEYRRVDVTVHNIGGREARSFDVALYNGNRPVGRKRVPNLPAPEGLVPSTVRIGFPFVPKLSKGKFRAAVDEEGAIDEIAERNNVAEVELTTPLIQRKVHAHP